MASRVRKARKHISTQLQLPTTGQLRLGLVSDTHSSLHPNTIALLKSLNVDAVLHAGDVGAVEVLEPLRAVAPLTVVRGNIDERTPDLPDTASVDIVQGERSLLKLVMQHIAVYGPKLRADAVQLTREHQARMMICGHSHVPFMGRDKGIVVFNPGSVGPRRGTLPITLGLLELSLSGVHMKHLSCETGELWMP